MAVAMAIGHRTSGANSLGSRHIASLPPTRTALSAVPPTMEQSRAASPLASLVEARSSQVR